MKNNFEKRRCHRFEIPGAYVRYKKGGAWRINRWSDRRNLVNISKGGVCFEGDEKIGIGDHMTVSLCLPDGVCWSIKDDVIWQKGDDSSGFSVGVQFAAFKNGYGYNSPEILEALRSLESLYLHPQDDHHQVG